MVNFTFGFGEVAADEEDVYTNRFTLGSLAADPRIDRTCARTGGITLLGFASNETTEATWMIPVTPVVWLAIMLSVSKGSGALTFHGCIHNTLRLEVLDNSNLHSTATIFLF